MRLRLLGNGRYRLLRRRYAAGSRDADGLWARGAASDTPFTVSSLQELPGRRRDAMLDGTRLSDYRVVYTERGFLRTEDDKATPKVEADEVVDCDSGTVYKVVSVKDDSGLIPHQRCDLLRLREGPR